MITDSHLIQMVCQEAYPLSGESGNLEPLYELIGDAQIVMLGEATHGTHEFYQLRAEISKQLILRKGFDVIAVEADWPDALRVSKYIQGVSGDRHPLEALQGFQRFPLWMWRNQEIVRFIRWLRFYNKTIHDTASRIGFFGLDLYSLRTSMESVLRYLDQIDPESAQQARQRYACFDQLQNDPSYYGYAVNFGLHEDCKNEVIQQLVELSTHIERYLHNDEKATADELFYAQQNARVVRGAEAYYRAMFKGRAESWNLRDTHMADTLEALQTHLIQQHEGRPAKLIVWAHNSHIGDARATEREESGQINLGQLVRERQARLGSCFLLGFTTYTGTVIAASKWGAMPEQKVIRPAHIDSYENMFHHTRLGNFLLPLKNKVKLRRALSHPRLERAIGVIYLPRMERLSHYFHADLPRQLDAVIHIDTSEALRPLDAIQPSHRAEIDTYPTGL